MYQHEATTRTPLPRRLVRLLVLAGAAVVWWLLISGGPAHADDTGTDTVPAPDTTTAAVAPTPAESPAAQVPPGRVEDTVAAATAPMRDLPQRTADTADRATAGLPESVRQTAAQATTTLEPTLASTTNGLADVVDQTATRVDTAVVDPVLQTTGLQATQPATTPPSSAANAHTSSRPAVVRTHQRHLLEAGDTAPPAVRHAALPDSSGADESTGATGQSNQKTPGAPDLPGAPSTSTVGGAVALLAGLAVLPPALLLRRRRHDGDVLPGGPAYPPGSSPG